MLKPNLGSRLADDLSPFMSAIIVVGLLLTFPYSGRSQSVPALPGQEGTDGLRDITGIEESTPLLGHSWWPYALGLAAVMMASLLLAGWKYYRSVLGETKETASSWALAEMRRIDSLHLAESGHIEQFHRLYAEVIRQYLEKRFQVCASRQTTPEFLQTMRDSPLLSPMQREILKDCLERCDLAKFANVQFPKDECKALSQSVHSLVMQTSSDEPNPTLKS
jgi:hypothetical protein